MNTRDAIRSVIIIVGAVVALNLVPAAEAQTDDAALDALVREGIQHFEQGDLQAAQASFESVLEQNPNHIAAAYELAYTHLRLGEMDRGLALLDRIIDRGGDVPAQVYSLSASILDNQDRKDEAIARFEAGIAAWPDNHNLHLNLGITYIAMGNGAAARPIFEKAISLQPTHPTAHFYLGQIYAREGLQGAGVIALGTSILFDNNSQRMAAAANLIKSLMDGSIQLTDDGKPIVVLPVDALQAVTTIPQFSAKLPMHFATGLTLQTKAEADTSYEPYAIAFGLLITELAQSEIDPASHFAADFYREFYGPIAENGHANTVGHLALGTLNGEVATGWLQDNLEAITAFTTWSRTR